MSKPRRKRLFEFRNRIRGTLGPRRPINRNLFRRPLGQKVKSYAFRRTQVHFREVQKQFDADIFQKGLYKHFAENPIGTTIGLCLIFLTIFYLGSGVGPITNATIANDFTILYNNTAGWLGPLVFFAIFIPSMALAVFMPKSPQPVVMVQEQIPNVQELEASQESSM